MRPRLAIFDCDGTLADSERSIVDAVQAAFDEHGLPRPTREQVVGGIGLSLDDFLPHVAPGLDRERGARVVGAYRAHFSRLRTERGADPLFAGVGALLEELLDQGVLLGVATGKSRRGLLDFLDAHGLRSAFVTLQTADDAPGKPHPAMVERALADTGTTADAAVMIGDTSFDMGAALNAGVRGIGVTWGHHDARILREAGAAVVVESVAALRAQLLDD